jgi:peptidoglycan/LPS O-acetylase OafA/YrhL
VTPHRADRFGAPANHLLPSVQWLRAIAAMMVVIHHINFHTDWLREQAAARRRRCRISRGRSEFTSSS